MHNNNSRRKRQLIYSLGLYRYNSVCKKRQQKSNMAHISLHFNTFSPENNVCNLKYANTANDIEVKISATQLFCLHILSKNQLLCFIVIRFYSSLYQIYSQSSPLVHIRYEMPNALALCDQHFPLCSLSALGKRRESLKPNRLCSV